MYSEFIEYAIAYRQEYCYYVIHNTDVFPDIEDMQNELHYVKTL